MSVNSQNDRPIVQRRLASKRIATSITVSVSGDSVPTVTSSSSSSSSSGTMGPGPVGVHCLSCNEFPSSVILGQTVQLL